MMDHPTESTALQRFAQAQAPIYLDALAELRASRKRTHWIWFTFPQLADLGQSAMSQRFSTTPAPSNQMGLPESYMQRPWWPTTTTSSSHQPTWPTPLPGE